MPGVGGRRWAKFAKYLNREKVDVRVICSKNFLEWESPWTKDITEYKDKIIYMHTGYLSILGKNPSSFKEKIEYRVNLLRVKKKVEANYFDRSAHWEKGLTKELDALHASGYDKVLITGGPFHYCEYVTTLESRFYWIFETPGLRIKRHLGLLSFLGVE